MLPFRSLPVAEVPGTPLTIFALHELSPVQGQTILLVDDEPAIATALTKVLARDGHTVDIAPTAGRRSPASRDAPMT